MTYLLNSTLNFNLTYQSTHDILWQDMQGVFERLSEERVSMELDSSSTVESIITSTTSPPLVVDETSASTNAVVHSEVPRLLSW